MSDYLDTEEVKKITDAIVEVTVSIPIDKNTKFPVKILTEGQAKEMVLKALEDVKAEIEERSFNYFAYQTTLFAVSLEDVLEIIDGKVNEVKHDCTACKHSDEVDGSNCYECVKSMVDNFEVNEVKGDKE